MSRPGKPTAYKDLIQHHQPSRRAGKSAEELLDSLLQGQPKAQAGPAVSGAPAAMSGLDRLREKMRSELIPAFEELRAKYEDRGVIIALDPERFLAGGVEILIEVKFETFGLRMEGTVTPEGIAFHETRFSDDMLGVVTTGPMLRARNLNGQSFREFMCERVAQLVRSAVRRSGG
ncbi:MAG: hypothetical protein ACE5GE_01140 [Phycisphaerae bacterium]